MAQFTLGDIIKMHTRAVDNTVNQEKLDKWNAAETYRWRKPQMWFPKAKSSSPSPFSFLLSPFSLPSPSPFAFPFLLSSFFSSSPLLLFSSAPPLSKGEEKGKEQDLTCLQAKERNRPQRSLPHIYIYIYYIDCPKNTSNIL